jgi:dTMP kinase
MVERGKLFVLEAVDDATLARLSGELCHWLRECGLAVEETQEPTYGPAGTQILLARQGRLHFDPTSLALLYLADRLDHVQRSDGIESWLEAGKHVICTHYRLAAAAWLWGEVEWDWLCRIETPCCVPDMTLYVDMRETHKASQERLQAGYRAAIQRMQNRGQDVSIVDGAGPPEKLHLACKRHMARLLELELADRDRE